MVVEVLECGADGKGGERPEGALYIGVDAGDDLVRGAVARRKRRFDLGQPLVPVGYVVVERGGGVGEHGAVAGEQGGQLGLVGEPP